MRTLRNFIIAAGLLFIVPGCHHRHVVYVHEENDVWDGHVWVTVTHHVHGSGCGHYWHHGAWHLYPADYVYLEAGWAPWGVYVDYRDEPASGPCHAWDGSAWVVVRSHDGCYYHHGAWHVYPERHVYERPDKGHFGARISPHRREPPPTRTPDRPERPKTPRQPK